MDGEASGSGAGPADGADLDEQQQHQGHDEAEPVPRDALGRWVQGYSGNPAGRPPVLATVRDLARAHTALAVQVLASIAADRAAPPGARIVAARELLDRGHGRASAVELVTDLALVSDAELDRMVQLEEQAQQQDLPPDLATLSDEALDALRDEP